MRQINLVEGKVVAPQGMKVGIVAARFNEIIVNKLLGGAVDGLVRHGVEEEGNGDLSGKSNPDPGTSWNFDPDTLWKAN